MPDKYLKLNQYAQLKGDGVCDKILCHINKTELRNATMERKEFGKKSKAKAKS